MLRIAIGCDHGGYVAKENLKNFLVNNGYDVIDKGTNSLESCNYAEYGELVGLAVANGEADYGVVICTSGEGIMMAANKVKGIRCGIGYNDEVSKLMRQHNDANVISFGAKFIPQDDINRRTQIFITTEFEGGRHEVRVNKIKSIEKVCK